MVAKDNKKQETINEAWRVFADAMNYSDDLLIGYVSIVKSIFGEMTLHRFQDRDILLSKIDAAIATLTPKEQEIILMRYGLNGNGPMFLKELALHFNVTRERVRQIEAKALRKLRHPIRSHYIISKERKKHEEILALAEKKKSAAKLLKQDTAIENIDFSIRTYNCLKRAGIETMGQLVELSYDDLIRIRNMGNKCIQEVLDIKANFLNEETTN